MEVSTNRGRCRTIHYAYAGRSLLAAFDDGQLAGRIQPGHTQLVHGDLVVPALPVAEDGAPRPGRNALCPCGSGKKYKRCCG